MLFASPVFLKESVDLSCLLYPPYSSATLSVNFFMTPLEKWALLASYSSTSLWIASSWVNCFIFYCISSSLKISFYVCLLWYSNSLVNWWFWRIVNLVVVVNCSFFKDRRFVLIYLIFLSISKWIYFYNLSVCQLPELFNVLYLQVLLSSKLFNILISLEAEAILVHSFIYFQHKIEDCRSPFSFFFFNYPFLFLFKDFLFL